MSHDLNCACVDCVLFIMVVFSFLNTNHIVSIFSITVSLNDKVTVVRYFRALGVDIA